MITNAQNAKIKMSTLFLWTTTPQYVLNVIAYKVGSLLELPLSSSWEQGSTVMITKKQITIE